MGNIILATPLISDLGEIVSVGSEVASMEAVNLLKIQPTDLWRASDLDNIWFEIDLGSAKAIRLVAMLFTNASSSATMRVRGATSQGNLVSSPGYDSTAVSHWPTSGLDNWDRTHGIDYNDIANTFRWWRIDIADASNPDGFYEAGRCYLSTIFQPTLNINFNWDIGWKDSSAIQESAGQQSYPEIKNKLRELKFTLDFQSESQMFGSETPFETDRLRGSSKDILAIIDPDNADRIMDWTVYGLMKNLKPISNPNFQLYRKSFVITEMI